MKGLKTIVLIFPFFLFTCTLLKADPINKKNLGFEKGNFDGWVGYTWIYRTDVPRLSTGKVEGIVSGRHTIMSNQSEYDANTGGKLKVIPNGYKYSARLGSTHIGGQHQSLSYTMKVDSTNALLVWKFAVVLQDPTRNHQPWEEPRFTISLFDENGDTIQDCSNYDIYATDARINGFKTYYPEGSNSEIVWRDWTTVGANLLPYYGQTVTIEFVAADCTHLNHYGYAYFVLDCMPLSITVDFCTSDSVAILSAPSGFLNFSWTDTNGNIVDSVQNLLIENPLEGETYICDMESETGCSVTLSTKIARYEQEAGFSSKMLDCNSNMVQFTNLSTHSNGTLSYLWDFGDGETSEAKEPVYKFKTSGMHQVGLILYNPPSGCTDTLYQEVESFSPRLVGFTGDTTYCPGMTTEVEAYGAYSYEWSTGNSTEKLKVGAPGGNFWLLGRSSEGCVSDTIQVNISEEPDWTISIFGDTFLCHGRNGVLFAEGAVDYLWNTGDTNDSIYIFEGGSYNVAGHNLRGCQNEVSIDITEIPVPSFNFSISTNSVNIRHNLVEGSAYSSDSVTFQWDAGDGVLIDNSDFVHYYSIPEELIKYIITVKATNEYGCSMEKSDYVNVDLFVPNVFTPNSDGINDLFMPGYDLKILDRHGIVIYNGQNGWNGFYKGNAVDPDTYYYVLNYTDAEKENRVKKGYITLVR